MPPDVKSVILDCLRQGLIQAKIDLGRAKGEQGRCAQPGLYDEIIHKRRQKVSSIIKAITFVSGMALLGCAHTPTKQTDTPGQFDTNPFKVTRAR